MTEEEVQAVAEELAKVGGTSWYPGRDSSPFLRIVSDRYRDRARVAIAALDRFRTGQKLASSEIETTGASREAAQACLNENIHPGMTVIYRPPGDQRAYSCQVIAVEGDRVYLEPVLKTCTGWISLENLIQSKAELPGLKVGRSSH